MALAALIFCYTTFQANSYSTSSYFQYIIFAMIVLIPLLTMRMFSEERKMRTEQLLLTSPVTIFGMVMGKFCAALTLFVGSLALSCINFIPLYSVAASEIAAKKSLGRLAEGRSHRSQYRTGMGLAHRNRADRCRVHSDRTFRFVAHRKSALRSRYHDRCAAYDGHPKPAQPGGIGRRGHASCHELCRQICA